MDRKKQYEQELNAEYVKRHIKETAKQFYARHDLYRHIIIFVSICPLMAINLDY
ncbi:hypothetical protein [Streptococcus agalactiae]|uniref:hypothetical protein n=1 Tax=Streptococcus agalactiae TaxID=1311 RepID=UPI003C7945C6